MGTFCWYIYVMLGVAIDKNTFHCLDSHLFQPKSEMEE